MKMAATSETRAVLVTEVDQTTSTATCLNTRTGGEFPANIELVHGYNRPRPGDAWMMTKIAGQWAFDYLIEGQVQHSGVASASDLMQVLDESGVPWRPGAAYSPVIPAEVPGWPTIGEERLFPTTGLTITPLNWVKCNGSLQQIARYPQLYQVLGTTYGGDGITTFGVPNRVSTDNFSRGIMAKGTMVGATVDVAGGNTALLATGLVFTPLLGRNYRIVFQTRAASPTSAGRSSGLFEVLDGVSVLGVGDYWWESNGSYGGLRSEWSFTGDGVSRNMSCRVTVNSGMLTTRFFVEVAGNNRFYIEDVGPTDPTLAKSTWYILAED